MRCPNSPKAKEDVSADSAHSSRGKESPGKGLGVAGFGRVCTLLLLVLFSSLTQSLSSTGGQASAQFRIEAAVTLAGPVFDEGGRASHASIEVQDQKWSITMTPVNWPDRKLPTGYKALKPLAYQLASDGTNTFEIVKYDPREFRRGLSGTVAERWAGATPGSRAAHHEVYALWYAFASAHYFNTTAAATAIPALQPISSHMQGQYERSSLFPRLPGRVFGTNEQGTHTWDYQVDSFTNVFGLSVPLRAKVLCTRSGQQDWEVSITTLSVSTGPITASFTGDLEGKRTIFYDATVQKSELPTAIRIESDHWPTSNEIAARSKPTGDLPARGDSGARNTMVPRLVLAAMLLGPVGILLYSRLKNTKSKKP